jgi:putative membrane protein
MMHGNGWYGHSDYSFWGGHVFNGWYSLIMVGVLIIIVALILMFRKKNKSGNQALDTLKVLYVKGEITEEEYLKRKNVIER